MPAPKVAIGSKAGSVAGAAEISRFAGVDSIGSGVRGAVVGVPVASGPAAGPISVAACGVETGVGIAPAPSRVGAFGGALCRSAAPSGASQPFAVDTSDDRSGSSAGGGATTSGGSGGMSGFRFERASASSSGLS